MKGGLALVLLAVIASCARPPSPPSATGQCQNLPRKLLDVDFDGGGGHACGVPTATLCVTDPQVASIVVPDSGFRECTCTDPTPFLGTPVLLDWQTQKANQLADAGRLRGACHRGADANRCPDPTRPEGCGQWFTDPVGCARLGFVHGFAEVTLVGDGPTFGFHDGDNHFNVCPISSGAQVPATGITRENEEVNVSLDTRSWQECNLQQVTEHQWCRWYGGPFDVAPGDAGHPARHFDEFRPTAGERVSVIGDWLVEDGWTEIHETRLNVTVRRDQSEADVFHLLTSAFFAEESHQTDFLAMTVPVPRSADLTRRILECKVGASSQGGCSRFISPNGDVTIRAEPDSDAGTCRIFLARNGEDRVLSSFECGRGGDFLQPNPTPCPCDEIGKCPTTFDRCEMVGTTGAPKTVIAYAGDIRAWWHNSLDLWNCACACDDPSTPGASIVAPVHGCVPAFSEDDKDEGRTEACAFACGGTMCGDAPACRIGQCRPVAGTVPFADAIGTLACQSQLPNLRMARAGDYMVQLDPSVSRLRAGVATKFGFVELKNTPVNGAAWINTPTPQRLQFADLEVVPVDFSVSFPLVGDFDIQQASGFALNRFDAILQADGGYEVPAGAAVLGAQAFVNELFGRTRVQTQGPLMVSFDLATDSFTLNANGVAPDAGVLKIELFGRIVNHPPTASTAGSDRRVECTSSAGAVVKLTALSSTDPDVGDQLTHAQWFEGNAGAGNQFSFQRQLSLGSHQFELHVYDRQLASAQSLHQVDVVDTTAPQINVPSDQPCLWPPNHELALFGLAADLGVTVSDQCDPTAIMWIDSVAGDEAALAVGSGQTSPDVTFGTEAACVRAERQGLREGRTYTLTVKARDSSCNVASRQLRVFVPHDQAARPECRRVQGIDIRDARCTAGPAVRACP